MIEKRGLSQRCIFRHTRFLLCVILFLISCPDDPHAFVDAECAAAQTNIVILRVTEFTAGIVLVVGSTFAVCFFNLIKRKVSGFMVNMLNTVLSVLQIAVEEYTQHIRPFLQDVISAPADDYTAALTGDVADDLGLMKEGSVLHREIVVDAGGQTVQEISSSGCFQIFKVAFVDRAGLRCQFNEFMVVERDAEFC